MNEKPDRKVLETCEFRLRPNIYLWLIEISGQAHTHTHTQNLTITRCIAVAIYTIKGDLTSTRKPDYDSVVLKEERRCRRIWDLSSPLSVTSGAPWSKSHFPTIPQSARPLLCTLGDVNIPPRCPPHHFISLYLCSSDPPLHRPD